MYQDNILCIKTVSSGGHLTEFGSKVARPCGLPACVHVCWCACAHLVEFGSKVARTSRLPVEGALVELLCALDVVVDRVVQ